MAQLGPKTKGRKKVNYIYPANPDKEKHEHWNARRSLANIPRPYRCVAVGPPNSGKSTAIINLIANARPLFARIIVCSVDPEAKEWVHLCDNCEVYQEIPDFKEVSGEDGHTLVILEDLMLTSYKGEQEERLDRLFGHGSSHRNITVIATSQDLYRLPVCVRRQSNVFLLWPAPDVASINSVTQRVGLKKGELLDLFRELCGTNVQDYICLDLTDGSPAPIRFKLDRPVILE